MSLRQESPLLLCGLQECEKIPLLIAVAVRVRGVPFHPFSTDRKGGKCVKSHFRALWFEVDGSGEGLSLPCFVLLEMGVLVYF